MGSSEEPDLDALHALVECARLGSFSRAGAALGVSQQAVSQRIRSLEADLGVRLLARSPRGSHLTPDGELVIAWATPLLAAADDFAAAVRSLRDSGGPLLRIAASLTTAEHILPPWIARWRSHLGEDGPLVQVRAANSAAVLEAVRRGRADLGLVETPQVPTDLARRTIGTDTVEVVAPTTHRWARNRVISVPDLARTPLVLREEGSGTRKALEEALESAGHPRLASPALVVTTTLALRSAVMAGTAPGALSSLAVEDDLAAGRLVRIRVRGLTVVRPLTVVWAGTRPTAAARSFLELSPAAGASRTP